jgi:hypothetical protein
VFKEAQASTDAEATVATAAASETGSSDAATAMPTPPSAATEGYTRTSDKDPGVEQGADISGDALLATAIATTGEGHTDSDSFPMAQPSVCPSASSVMQATALHAELHTMFAALQSHPDSED